MSTTPAPLPVEMSDEIRKAIDDATSPDQIRAALAAEAQRQAAAKDAADAQQTADAQAEADRVAAEQAAATAQPTSVTRTEVIAGKEFNFEGADDADLDRQVLAAYKVAFAIQTPRESAPVVAAPDPAALAAAAEADAAAKVELELKFKRGEISASDYMEQSGALDAYLEKKGISVDALKAAVDQNEGTQFEKSWAQATEEFLHSSLGADWPGGDRNKNILGMRIAALNLIDAEDRVTAIAQAWADMKQNHLVFENDGVVAPAAPVVAAPAASTIPAVPAVTAPVIPAAPARPAATSSSLFDRSSGVSDFIQQPDKAKPAEFIVPPNASPTEIMDAYKKFLVANGQDPNTAFTQQFASKR